MMNPVPADSPLDRVGRGDRILLVGFVMLLAVAASLTPIASFDYWWHLATGRVILETGEIPRADPFSFTAAGTEWVDHEWLFQIGVYLLHTWLGPAALVLLKVIAVILLVLLMVRQLGAEGHGPAGMAIILMLTLLGSWFRLEVRPELATLLLLPLILYIVIRARDDARPRLLLMVPVLCALGANLHVGIVLVPALLGIGAVVTLLRARIPYLRGSGIDRDRSGEAFAYRLAAVAGASAILTGLNPYGYAIYAVPVKLSRLLASLPWPNLEWAAPEIADFPIFYATLALVLVITIVSFRNIDPVATPTLIVAAVLAALHLRNIGLFFLLLPFGIGRPLRALVGSFQRTRTYGVSTLAGRVRPGFITAAVLLVGAIPALVYLPPKITWGIGIASSNESAAAVDFLEREDVGDRLFNDVRFGGYLVWRRAPEVPVFIDGRNEIYHDLLHEIARGLEGWPAWEAMLERHEIDAAFLRYPGTLQKVLYPGRDGGPPVEAERAFSAAYFPKEHWALVYWDDDAMIFLRRGAGYDDVIGRLEYSAIHPDDWKHLWAAVAVGRVPAGPILKELERKLTEDPSSVRALSLLRSFVGVAGRGGGQGPGASGTVQ